MTCQVEQIADCGDISTLGRALFIPEKEDTIWLSQCSLSLSSCGNLLAVGYNERLCLMTTHWISSTDSNTYLISWSGTLPSHITAVLALPICSPQQSSQNGPDWFCIIVGFKNGCVGFYTNTGHLLLLEKLDEKPVMKLSCHTGPYGTMSDDIHILFQSCECIVSGPSLFQTLRNAKAQLARVQAGVQDDYSVDSRNINIRKWNFTDQEPIYDAVVVGLEMKNTYDHLLAASTYGGYDTWYRSVPPVNSLVLGAGVKPYVGFHYAIEGGTTPPLQDVARAVANKIKSALPGWLGGSSTDNAKATAEPRVQSELLSMRAGIYDGSRQGTVIAVSPDRRLAAVNDNLGRVAILDIKRGHLIRLFKGYRDAQCAFVQVFEQDEKKTQLSMIKEVKRAIFLIIYNPKKGLIDIRLMQSGHRVAVFTATKNGKLIYNTCGLVGAEKSFTHKKINLPELQCVLIDPDGKLKKFIIPFFYALDGEHSDRSKDLHILRDLRDYIKKNIISEENITEINKKISEIKTIELKKYCLEILIKNYGSAPKVITTCLETFWDSIVNNKLNPEEQKIKNYFINLGLITLFFRRLKDESTDDMQELVTKLNDVFGTGDKVENEDSTTDKKEQPVIDDEDSLFNLLEDDTCILERLLILAQENNYKEHQHAKVTFVDNNTNVFKDFLGCFALDDDSKYISLKPNIPTEKLSLLATDIFKSIYKMKNFKILSNFVEESRIDPKEVIKLLITHLMNLSLGEISIGVIEKLIAILYYICWVEKDAVDISYNEISPWWQNIRDVLVDMSCPLKSMMVAMACKAVSRIFENCSSDEVAWESVTKESAKWGILIGRLEDISILSIILMHKGSFNGKSLPKLQVNDCDVNLKYIYARGKGSVTELIAKWLCSMGVIPEAIIANELMETNPNLDSASADDEGSLTQLFIENNRVYVDENPIIFKWLSLLRQQFPLSTLSDYIIANMSWEYAMEWQKEMHKTERVDAVIHCLNCISNLYLRVGLFSIIWSTYIKQTFENSCRLVNKVGKLPKEPLCLQDVGLNNTDMLIFLEITMKYLERFLESTDIPDDTKKPHIQYEKIWDESMASLVEVAQNTNKVNNDFLNLNYQMSCTVYYLCHFNLKYSKPLDSLFDIDYQYILDALTISSIDRNINIRASEKVRNPRMKFVTKLIRASVETVTCDDRETHIKIYNSEECTIWMKNISNLAEQWNIDAEFVRRQQIVSLYHMGYDELAIDAITMVADPESLLPPLLAITMQRLKRSLEHSSNQPEWIVTVPPNLYKRLQNTVLDPSIPAHPSLRTTMSVLQNVLYLVEKKSTESYSTSQDVKLAELAIDSCEVIIRCNLCGFVPKGCHTFYFIFHQGGKHPSGPMCLAGPSRALSCEL